MYKCGSITRTSARGAELIILGIVSSETLLVITGLLPCMELQTQRRHGNKSMGTILDIAVGKDHTDLDQLAFDM